MTRVCFLLAMAVAATAAAQVPPPAVSVREAGGAYVVEARFDIAAAPAIVRAVLTDYAGIPRFMPDIRTSVVRSRDGNAVVVEQEAESKFLMFSKTVHLMLDVREGAHVLSFKDIGGKSFTRYEGSWTLSRNGAGTTVTYMLTADPSFTVPGGMLRRLLDRNARQTIDHLRAEAVLRATSALRAAR
jgi:carbon monoxide dehydrogenase subunit G